MQHLTFPPVLYEGSVFSTCLPALVNVYLLGFKQLLFLASSPKQLGRIRGGGDALQFTLNLELTLEPIELSLLGTSPPRHAPSPSRAAFGAIVRIHR